MQLESVGGRRREVGVHLHGMVKRQCQVVGELGQMGIGQLESLQHDGGATIVQFEHSVRLDHVFDRAMTDPRPTAVHLRQQGRTVTHEAEEERPDAPVRS